MNVPYFDLGRAVQPMTEEVLERWRRLLERTAFVGGAEVAAFEQAFATATGTNGCVGVANGTDALVLALRALDLQPGDEVVVPDFTFIATASAVIMAGGRPVLADVEPTTLNLDPASAARAIGAKTAGIIGVHLYGRPFDLDSIGELCDRHGLWLLEDAAQAQGASWKGAPVGGFGKLATWSFYPAKNLGAFGDAGAVTGNDPDLLERVRRLANHGRVEHYRHAEVGTNSRLDALQATVLSLRLEHLAADNHRRREIAGRYSESFAGMKGVDLLWDLSELECVYHQYAILSPRRDELKDFLAERGVGSGIHYPLPLHLQPSFSFLPEGGPELPVATRAAREVLCLPMFPQLTGAEVSQVIELVRSFFCE